MVRLRLGFMVFVSVALIALLAALPLATGMDRNSDGRLDRVEFARW